MMLRFLGHAGFILETAKSRLIIDPWFGTAFLGTWRPQPDNSFLRDEVERGQYDALCISHGHDDHHDFRLTQTLRMRSAAAVFFMPSFMQPRYRLSNYVFSGPWDMRDMRLETIEDSYRQDSMLLVEVKDGPRILFANDCNTSPAEWPKNIDILACQFSGASYYPTAYDYPPDVMARKVEEARARQMDMLVEKVRLCGAKRYLPCAGPAKIEGVADGPGTAFPHWNEVADEFARRCPDVAVTVLQPGDWLDDELVTITKGATTFTMPRSILAKIEAGACTWEEALLSFKVKLHRDPDVYDADMMETLRGRDISKRPQ